jgi:hypothetical protein
MEEVSIIGLDLAKRRLQAHGARPVSWLWRPAGVPITGDAPSALSVMKFG